MITSINEFKKILEAKTDGIDLVIVDVQEGFKKFFGEAYLEALNEFCEGYNRVFQIYDINKLDYTDYTFPNQVLSISKKYGSKLNEEDVLYLFSKPLQEIILNKFKTGFFERDMFETINGDYWVYIDGKHKWFFCTKELADLFKGFVKQSRKIILVGGAANECLKDIFVTMKALGVNVEYNLDLVYSSKGSKYQQQINNDNNY